MKPNPDSIYRLSQSGMIYLAPVTLLALGALLICSVIAQKAITQHKTIQSLVAYQDAKFQANQLLKRAEQALKQHRALTEEAVTVVNSATVTGQLGHTQQIINLRASFRFNSAGQHVTVHRQYVRYSALLVALDSALIIANTPSSATNVRITSNDVPLAYTVTPPSASSRFTWCEPGAQFNCQLESYLALPFEVSDISSVIFNRSKAQLTVDDFQPVRVQQDCRELERTSQTVMWIDGDCDIDISPSLGSATHPVLLIINNGRLTVSANQRIYGVVVMIKHDNSPVWVNIAPSAGIQGQLIIDGTLASGSRIHAYADKDIVTRLQQSRALTRVQPVRGSYRDF